MKRSLEPLQLPRSPLIYIVAQVGISAVVAIERYVPALQEKLRRNGFPGFLQSQFPEFVFESPAVAPVTRTLSRFEFQDREARTGIVLTPKSIAVHTNSYTTFDKFHETIAMALESVHVEAELQLHERIGLRYVDLIELDANEKLADYVAPNLLGYEPASVAVYESTFQFQFEGRSSQGKLFARHYAPPVANMLPPDLAGVSLNYSYRVPPLPGKASLLDFDHAAEAKSDFVISNILETLELLHDGLDIIFRKSVTDSALRKWGMPSAN